VSQIGPALGLGPAVAVANNYGDHPITRDFGNGITFFPLAQAVDLVGEAEKEGVPLLLTGPGVWAESRLDREPFFDPGEDRSGPLSLGVALTKGKGRLVVIGDSEFAADGLFDQQLNGDLFLNTVGWLAGGDASTLSIRPKEATNRRLNLTQAQGNILALAALLIVPVGGFATAGILWWRRR
ncbi:MAG: ABC transporter, partial [Gloeomargaritaceae cyanobacterium C42_A2020_066]|nr:ABC transporter [Gloeomargaritaceae cyanobacterium C42_A2020_066]